MRSLHEYEAWLDTIDDRFRLYPNCIEYKFDEYYLFKLSELNELQSLILQAEILRNLAFNNTEGLPLEYMCKRLVRLANQGNETNIDADYVAKELHSKWGGFYRSDRKVYIP